MRLLPSANKVHRILNLWSMGFRFKSRWRIFFSGKSPHHAGKPLISIFTSHQTKLRVGNGFRSVCLATGGVSVQGVSFKGALCLGGVPVQGSFCPVGSLSGGLCHGELPPPPLEDGAVSILLECFIVQISFSVHEKVEICDG